VAKENEGIIIAADTFLSCEGKVLEKPRDLAEAKEMLKLESNNKLIAYTGFCYLDKLIRLIFQQLQVRL